MNAIELLLADHREALMLIEALGNADVDQLGTASEETNPVRMHETNFNKLKNALNVHTHIEEEIFYPAVEGFEEIRGIIEGYYGDHQQVDGLLEAVANLSPTEDEWIERIGELRENLHRHIDKEEKELFPKAEELLGEQKLRELYRQIEEMKNTRPAAKASAP